jgi:hypothetical protein
MVAADLGEDFLGFARNCQPAHDSEQVVSAIEVQNDSDPADSAQHRDRQVAYFAKKLLDFDLAANNGGWQWAAGCGCDAAPYFRVFNPYIQTEKFDPDHTYIKKWVPEFESNSYPKPIIEHVKARERVLSTYKKALQPV